jgi:two-component system chemotaxis response regulator CheB
VEAVAAIARALPPTLPAAVCVVIHFPDRTASALPQILNRAGNLPAAHAADAEPVRAGRIYIAPPGCHLTVADARLRVRSGPKENGHRPAIDPLFRSAAREYGTDAIGVILSGNLDDGTAGLAAIKRAGGLTIVQEPDDALFGGMPRSAVRHVGPDYVVPLDEIPALLKRLTESPAERGEAMPQPSEIPPAHAEWDPGAPNGEPSGFTCPECHGALWASDEPGVLHYRCRVGHAYSAESLLAAHDTDLEAALWTALRSLEEHAAMSRRMSVSARKLGHPRSASAYAERALDSEHHAAIIRRTIEEFEQRSHPAAEDLAPAEPPAVSRP